MFNKGLPHADTFVKHGTLRLLLELLKLLDSLFGSLNHNCSSGNPLMQHMVSVKQEIQNYVQPFLPDLQVLLNLLSSLDTCYESNNSSLKRNACHLEHDGNSRKKLKMDTSESDIDIIIGGISSAPDIDLTGNSGTVDDAVNQDALDDAEDLKNSIGEIWGSDVHSIDISTPKDAESYLLSKLLDALRYFNVCSVLFHVCLFKPLEALILLFCNAIGNMSCDQSSKRKEIHMNYFIVSIYLGSFRRFSVCLVFWLVSVRFGCCVSTK
jgi:nucleolar pre-ribosomal-associated protein 1